MYFKPIKAMSDFLDVKALINAFLEYYHVLSLHAYLVNYI